MSQETTNLLASLIIGGGVTIFFMYKISEIASILKQIRDKISSKE